MTSRFAIASLFAFASIATAETITVPGDHATIQEALDASVGGDVIEVAPGIYTGSGDAVVTMPTHPVTLRTTGGAAVTTIDGEGARRGVVIEGSLFLYGATQWRVEDGGNGHWYLFVDTPMPWAEASARAQATGSHLATNTSSTEDSFVDGLIAATEYGGTGDFWIGGYQPPGSSEPLGNWIWETGEPWSYTNWGQGEPNDSGSWNDGDQQALEIVSREVSGGAYFWQDEDEELEQRFVIEWSADCNGDGIVDYGQILDGSLVDADGDGVPDICGRMQVGAEVAVIEGFTIVNGYADGGGGDGIGDGGGMLIDGASPIIRDCVFESNEAFDEGGGLYVMDGAPQVIDCDFGNGQAGSKGGGISLVRSAALLQGCDVHGNASDYNGGGLHLHESEALLDGCFIRNNQAGDDGGGLLLFESVATLSSCEVSGNTCEYDGAGIAFVSNSDASVSDCIITGNTIASAGEGGGWGGGLYCLYSSPHFTGCTASGNTSNTVGGGLASHWSNPSFVDSIVCGNIPDQLHNVDGDGWGDNGGNLFVESCPVAGVCCIAGVCTDLPYDDDCSSVGGLWLEDSVCSGTTCPSGTITVCASGCDFADIQAAVDYASPGEVIEIGDGVYTSTADSVVTLPAYGLTLRGTSFDVDGVPTTVLDGEGVRRGISIQSSGGLDSILFEWAIADGGNGHWYEVVEDELSWFQASDLAALRGGYLVTITSSGENQMLCSAGLPSNQPRPYWAGGHQPSGTNWVWVTGESWSYTNWDGIEPTNCCSYGGYNADFLCWRPWQNVATCGWSDSNPFHCSDEPSCTPRTLIEYDTPPLAPTVIEGLLIRNGFVSEGDGGGVLIGAGSPSFIDCHIIDNQVTGISGPGNGGGVYCDGSSPSFTNCVISSNVAQRWGGGVALFSGASGTFDGCRIDSNTADNGGGFMLVSSDLSMTSCSVEGNAASDDGGGVLFESGGDGSFTDCRIQGNSAGDSGGGLDCQAANSMLLTGCTICGNVSEQVAGSWTDGSGNLISEQCFGPWQWRVEDGGNGHWYAFETGLIPWSDARVAAMQVGGHLACMETETEWIWVRDELVEPLSDTLFAVGGWGVCIGGYQDLDSPDYSEPYGGWTWLTGAPFACGGEFDCNMENFTGNQHKMSLVRNAGYPIQFNDIDEVPDQPYYMIEWSADCNGDGIVDYGQILDGTLLDDDGDGVPDCCQYTECVTAVQWRIEDGGNGNWYLYNWDQTTGPEGVCWSEARARSLATGGDLVAVSTPEESDFLLHALCPIAGAANGNLGWLGLMPDGSGSYLWSNGEPFDWEFWGDGQPSGDGSYAAFGCDLGGSGGSSMSWNDIGGSGGCHTSGSLPLAFWITEYFADCNGDGIVDYGQILDGTLLDEDGDGVPNECDPDSAGVCCLDGACVETTYGACADGGGTWFTGFDCSALSCVAGTYSVCADGCDFTDIQSAIDHAVFGGVIEVGPGTWDVELVTSGASIEFRSTDGYAATWLDGGDSHRIFLADDVAGATIKFVGFTFANGDADVDDGGALYVDGNTLVLEDCRFISNRAQYGGAVACRNGSLTMTDCIVGQAGLGNVVPEDGGGIHFSDSTLLISGTTFDANESSLGGGLMAVRSAVTVDECTFTANRAMTPSSSENQAGGAIEFHSCPSMSVTGCEFVDNEARDGGALCLQNPFDYSLPAFVIDGCLFDSNLVDGKGGAIYIGSNAGTVDACEFLNNDADIQGSAIFIAYAGEGISASLTYSNSLFCGSGPVPVEAYDEQPILIDGGGNTIIEDVGDCVVDGSSWIGGGDTSLFSDQANWLFGAVPGAGSDVYFNLDEIYQVDFNMDADSRSIDVSAGDVTFDLSGFSYELDDDQEGDEQFSYLRIGKGSDETFSEARLTLVSSSGTGILTSHDDIDIANETGFRGTLAIDGEVRLLGYKKIRVGTSGIGTLRMLDGAFAYATTAEIGDNQGSQGTVLVSGSDTELRIDASLNINRGLVQVDQGTLRVNTGNIYIFQDGVLQGDGVIDASVINYGTFDPGDAPGGVLAGGSSSFRINEDYIQVGSQFQNRPPGILRMDVDSDGSSWLDVQGTAELAGGLVVDGDGTFDPSGHLLLQAPEVEGQFDVALMPNLDEQNKYMSLRYESGQRGGQVVSIVIDTLDGDVGFDPLTPPELAVEPGGLAVGDLAGDGSADDIAVAIAGESGSIEIYLNDGSGGFGQSESIAISQYEVGELVAYDVDGDGDADLLTSNRTGNELLVIENLGNGDYSQTPVSFTTAAGPIGLAVVDLHPADGVVDYVAVACNGAGSVQLFRNESDAGTGSLNFVLDGQTLDLEDPIDIDPIDENEDKDIKLLVALRGPGEVVMLAGSAARLGSASLQEVLRVEVGGGPIDIVTGLLDGDDLFDVVTVNEGDGTISVLVNDTENPAEPRFRPAVNLVVGPDPRSITLVDLDADGDRDIALAVGNDVTVLRNDSDEGSETLLLAPAAELGVGGRPLLVDHGLVDTDQQPDIVTINAPDGRRDRSYEGISLRKGDDVKLDPCEQADITGGSGVPDGIVNVQDLLLVIAQWNCSGSCVADIDSSGAVGVTDLLLIISWWGECGN